ncbi:hypothetical protein ACNHYB_01015 [Isoptericola jiangsuensis]|uniref:hypothetical protein n=1 Tax=Isoptericola jiangsuensis TaxID=548579 RepID=UPI003AAAFA7B
MHPELYHQLYRQHEAEIVRRAELRRVVAEREEHSAAARTRRPVARRRLSTLLAQAARRIRRVSLTGRTAPGP